MARCCQGSTCSCVLAEGAGITITGDGSSQNPFEISSSAGGIEVLDNSVFNLILTGDGSGGNPFTLSVEFAATAGLDDLPDVNAPAPTNGQVLAWDSSTSRWVAAAPTTAPTGAVTTDTSLTGDGSIGDPLEVQEDPDRFLTTTVDGLGLSDEAINNTVRHYADAAARTADPIAPADNTLSMLDTEPGVTYYWDGAAWVVAQPYPMVVIDGAFLELSGPYVDGMPLTHVIKQVFETTDGSGIFEVLSATDLTGAAGVLSCQYTSTGTLSIGVVLESVDGLSVSGHAWHLTNGTAWPAQAVTGIVDAWLY